MDDIKKNKKTKLIVISMLVILLIGISVSVFYVFNTQKDTQERLLTNNSVVVQSVMNSQTTNVNKSDVKNVINTMKVRIPDPHIKNPLTKVNPRTSFLNNTGQEQAYIDHEGNIGLLHNLTSTSGWLKGFIEGKYNSTFGDNISYMEIKQLMGGDGAYYTAIHSKSNSTLPGFENLTSILGNFLIYENTPQLMFWDSSNPSELGRIIYSNSNLFTIDKSLLINNNITVLGNSGLFGASEHTIYLDNYFFNGSLVSTHDVYTNDYFEIVPGVASVNKLNAFGTEIYEESSNPYDFIYGLSSSATVHGDLTNDNVYGIIGEGVVSAGANVSNLHGIVSSVTVDGNATNAYSLIVQRNIDGGGTVDNNLYGIYLEDFRPSDLSGTVNQGYAIYSAGGDVYFDDTDVFTILNSSNSANLCLNGVCYSSLASSSYNETYALYSYNQTTATYNQYGQWWYNMSDGSYNETYALYSYNQTTGYIPYTGANQNINFGNNNLTVGSSNTLFVNVDTNQVGIGTNVINDTYIMRITGSVLIEGNLTLYGNSSQLSFQNLSTNGSIIPGTDDAFNLGDVAARWKNGYFSTDVFIAGNSVKQWMYNQTYSGSTYNATYATWLPNYTAFSKYWYNMTYSGSTYNATYALYSYNQTTPAITSLNSTYGKWWYNQTIAANTSIVSTYGKWWYNQTIAANTSIYGAYGKWWYNQTIAANTSIFNAYGRWWYNQTSANQYWNVSGSNIFPQSLGYNVGIGTTTPSSKLSVVGNITSSDSINASKLCIGSDCRTSWASAGGANNTYINLPVQSAKIGHIANSARINGGTNRWRLVYQNDTGRAAEWQFQMPDSYSASSTLKADIIWIENTNTAGNVVWNVSVMALTAGDSASIETDSFDTANTATTAASGTANYPTLTTITLTNKDSVAASDLVIVKLVRDGSSASDTLNANAGVITFRLYWS